jgi:hypothetical protein
MNLPGLATPPAIRDGDWKPRLNPDRNSVADEPPDVVREGTITAGRKKIPPQIDETF